VDAREGGNSDSGAEGLRLPYEPCDSGEMSLPPKVLGVVGFEWEPAA
jgi:hypothetical protein